MKISNKKKHILAVLIGACGIFAYSQDAGLPPQNATPPQDVEAKAENADFSRAENSSLSRERIEYFRQRREARRAAREAFENGEGDESFRHRFPRRFNRPDFSRQNATAPSSSPDAVSNSQGDEQKNVGLAEGENELLRLLASKNPFVPAGSNSASQTPEGVSLKSAAMVDGKWAFSVSDKSGKTMWLGIGEEIENAPCKIDSFDESAMTAKATIAGRQVDLSISERSSSPAAGRVELVDAIKPRRMIAPHERAKVWSQYATDEQREAANRVWQTARAQGRNYLNREDRRKIFEIERSIQIPENTNQGGGQPPAPSR